LQKVLELKSSVSRVNFLKDILTREVIHWNALPKIIMHPLGWECIIEL
jgi:hypothetical protein